MRKIVILLGGNNAAQIENAIANFTAEQFRENGWSGNSLNVMEQAEEKGDLLIPGFLNKEGKRVSV